MFTLIKEDNGTVLRLNIETGATARLELGDRWVPVAEPMKDQAPATSDPRPEPLWRNAWLRRRAMDFCCVAHWHSLIDPL
jgi:hypothetical protein